MSDYTFHSLTEPLKNDSSIQTILDVDALAAPAKAALAGYVASLGLPASQTQHLTWENVGVAILIQTFALTYYLPSLGTQTPAPDTKRTTTMRDKVIEMQNLEANFPKCQLLLYSRTSAGAPWIWLNSEVIQNSGNRVNTLKLVPYLNQSSAFIPGKGTQIGLQFIADAARGATLPQSGDRLTVQGSVELDINPMDSDAKKNDASEALEIRLAALETLLQPFGAATATAAGTTGLVAGAAVGQSDHLLRGDRTWQNPAAFVRMLGEQLIGGLKTFAENITGNKTIRSVGAGDLGGVSAQSQAAMFATGGGGYFTLSSAPSPTSLKVIDFGLNSSGIFSVRRLNDAYNAVISTLLEFDAAHNLKLNNFTNFGGNVFSKTFLLRGTTPAVQGNSLVIVLGIPSAKVKAISPLVFFDVNGQVPPNFKQEPNREYEAYLDEGCIIFKLHSTNSSAILGKEATCLITYAE